MDKYEYPENLTSFFRGTKYQVLDPISKEWSETRTISKMCYSTKDYLMLLIRRKGIRIIKEN